MKFEEFLQKIPDHSFWKKHHNFCFRATTPSYPFSFFSLLLPFFNQKQTFLNPIKHVPNQMYETTKISALLTQSILGMHYTYWLGDVSHLAKEKKNNPFNLITSYTGPHAIIYFLTNSVKIKSDAIIIDLEDRITISSFKQLLNIFEINIHEKKLTLLEHLFQKVRSIPLDAACACIQYIDLIHTKMFPSFLNYFIKTLEIQPSLLQLAENFFSKNTKTFFSQWFKIKDEYPNMFWLAFWSEQVWKAFFVTNFLRTNDFAKAKKMSFRLPFTFLQRDWKKYYPSYFQHLYQQLYTIDYATKNGSLFCSFDLFYSNHFNNKR